MDNKSIVFCSACDARYPFGTYHECHSLRYRLDKAEQFLSLAYTVAAKVRALAGVESEAASILDVVTDLVEERKRYREALKQAAEYFEAIYKPMPMSHVEPTTVMCKLARDGEAMCKAALADGEGGT